MQLWISKRCCDLANVTFKTPQAKTEKIILGLRPGWYHKFISPPCSPPWGLHVGLVESLSIGPTMAKKIFILSRPGQPEKNRPWGVPWDTKVGPWAFGTLGPLGTLCLGDPWALGIPGPLKPLGLGDLGPWGPLGLGDPWALGTLGPCGPLGLKGLLGLGDRPGQLPGGPVHLRPRLARKTGRRNR